MDLLPVVVVPFVTLPVVVVLLAPVSGTLYLSSLSARLNPPPCPPRQYAYHLQGKRADCEEITPHLVASGAVDAAVVNLLSHSEHAEAQALAQAAGEGLLPSPPVPPPSASAHGANAPAGDPSSTLGRVSHEEGGEVRGGVNGAMNVGVRGVGSALDGGVNSGVRGGGGEIGGEMGDEAVGGGARVPHGLGAPSSEHLASLVAQSRARLFEEESQPALAACCFLAHHLPFRGVAVLIRHHELELALAVSNSLNLPSNDPLLTLLSSRAERLNLPPLATTLLRRTRDAQEQIPLLAARQVAAGSGEGEPIFSSLGLPPPSSYLQMAEAARACGKTREAIRCFAVCGEVAAAVALALPPLLDALGARGDLPHAKSLLEPLRRVPLDGENLEEATRFALLALSTFEACYQVQLPLPFPLALQSPSPCSRLDSPTAPSHPLASSRLACEE